MGCVGEFIKCVKRKAMKPPKHMSKARIQAYLAAMPDDGLRLGFAAKLGIWPLDDKAFDEVEEFIRLVAPQEFPS